MAERQLVVNIGADPEDDLPGVPSPYTEGARIMRAGDVPEGWEARSMAAFGGCTDPANFHGDQLVEARPIPVPDVVVTLPRDVAERFGTFWDFATHSSTSYGGSADVAVLVRAALDGVQ